MVCKVSYMDFTLRVMIHTLCFSNGLWFLRQGHFPNNIQTHIRINFAHRLQLFLNQSQVETTHLQFIRSHTVFSKSNLYPVSILKSCQKSYILSNIKHGAIPTIIYDQFIGKSTKVIGIHHLCRVVSFMSSGRTHITWPHSTYW